VSVAGQRQRLKDDAYYTPQWCVRALLSEVRIPSLLPVLDPCAGDGATLRAFGDGRELWANEIRAEEQLPLVKLCGAERVAIGDALELRLDEPSAVVTNPPFSLADEIVRSFVVGAGVRLRVPFAAFLLRMNWLAPQKRNGFARSHPPSEVVVLPRRPCFAHYCTRPAKGVAVCGATYPKSYTGPCTTTNRGSDAGAPCLGVVKAQTDAADYAWHVWKHERQLVAERGQLAGRDWHETTRLLYADLEACQ